MGLGSMQQDSNCICFPVNLQAGVFILPWKQYLFCPSFRKIIFPPLMTCNFFCFCRALFALILPYFAFILPFYLPFSLFPLSSFFFPLSCIFVSLFILILQNDISADYFLPTGGGGSFPIYRPLSVCSEKSCTDSLSYCSCLAYNVLYVTQLRLT
jgi:hypothetical protein